MSRNTKRKNRKRRRRYYISFPMIAVLALLGCILLLWKVGMQPTTVPSEPSKPENEEPATPPPPQCGDEPDAGMPETPWNLILVNETHPLGEDFQIPELTQLRNGHAIDSRAYSALQNMMDAARAEGLEPLICSSFRTRDKQSELFANKTAFYRSQGYSRNEAEKLAARWVARPGTSEHQTGLAVDIVDMNYQILDKQQEQTPVQLWLMEHCAEYGFILRYPNGKSDLTGVEYEPWHYRYVGVEAAKEIMEQGLCLEEYVSGLSTR